MKKKLQDLKGKKLPENIDLSYCKKAAPIEKAKNKIPKDSQPYRTVKDLHSKNQQHYTYIRGKKFEPPKYLGNLIKIGLVGFLLLFTVNSFNVYFQGEALKGEVSSTAKDGYNFLVDASKSATKVQFDNAFYSFEQALNSFSDAERDLWFITKDTSIYSQDNNLAYSVSTLLESGQHFSLAGKYMLEALEEFNNVPILFVGENSPEKDPETSASDSLKVGLEIVDLAIDEIEKASKKIQSIEEKSLPADLSSRVTLAKGKVLELSDTLNTMSDHFPAMLKLLGDRYPHRYLILLQNNNEIRPAGGFIGSYAIMDINDGVITNLEVHDSYDLNPFINYTEPPENIKVVTQDLRFYDANYSYDFPHSAKKARLMLEKQGGPSVDTVIAINQGLLKDLLEITGPVQVGNFGQLNSENYSMLLSFIIEGKVWGAEDPKHILKVFVPAFKEQVLQEKNLSAVGSKLFKAVQQKHITMYSADPDIQELFESMNMAGKAHQTQEKEDYLAVINISHGGTKADQFVDEEITHHTDIDQYGTIINTVTIKRTHQFSDAIMRNWEGTLRAYGFDDLPGQTLDSMGRGHSLVSMQVYVPEGSTLIESNTQNIATKYDKDLNKTYFFTSMDINAGQSDEITIKYKLPFILNLKPAAPYKLVVEKQPGSRGALFTKTIKTDPKLENIAIYPEETKFDLTHKATYTTNLVYDRYFSGLWSK